MAEQGSARPAAGNIYDLGYRNYDGARLGRSYAIQSLFVYTLLSIWGIGRSFWAKLFPMGLAFIALVPALILLGVAALLPEEFELAQAHEYFGFVSIILALFCAVSAPELLGRDQRNHTLALYFSRALARSDYITAKLAALGLSLFLILVVPQVFLQLGNAVASEETAAYLRDNAELVPPILASSLVVAAFMGALSTAVAVQTSRRAFSTGAVIAAFVILSALGGIFVNTLSGDARQFGLLISPFGLLEGAVVWIFGAEPSLGSDLRRAGLEGGYYLLAAIVYTLVALAIVYRRAQRLSV